MTLYHRYSRFAMPVAALGVAVCVAPPGCRSAGSYRAEADRVANSIIEEKQRQAFGRTEAFTLDQPADTLRRRLMLEQALPYSSPATFGTYYLEPIPHWPNDDYLTEAIPGEPLVVVPERAPLVLTLDEALQIAAQNSREYQTQKENVFLTALDLDFERDYFGLEFSGGATAGISTDLEGSDTTGIVVSPQVGLTQRFKNGVTITGLIGMDLVRLLTGNEGSSAGLFGDATITIPLLRGSGSWVVTEPLTQAERNALYAIYQFENFKRAFAVEVASEYLAVLQQLDSVQNSEENYRRSILAARRAERFSEAGLLPPIQVGQAVQRQLQNRTRWISARQNYLRRVDAFKLTLGLPPDARLELEPDQLRRLADSVREALAEALVEMEPTEVLSEDVASGEATQASIEPKPLEDVIPTRPATGAVSATAAIVIEGLTDKGAGPYELDEARAFEIALQNRLDLRVALGEVYDAERRVTVVADRLRPELTLLGTAATGERRTLASAGLDNALSLPLDRGRYEGLLNLDLPFDRTAERNQYRAALVGLERATRALQAQEDQVKFQVRSDLRQLQQSRENMRIQAEAIRVAERQVEATDLFLQAGRAEIRDVLEAQEDLIDAQDDLTSALVAYRVAELTLQQDLGVLEVGPDGLWREFDPTALDGDAAATDIGGGEGETVDAAQQ